MVTVITSPESTAGRIHPLQKEDLPEDLVAVVRAAKYVEVFTGAGMSADSGLDTFRDAQTGIWSHVDPQAMASLDAWAKDPEPMLAWYLWRAVLCRRADANAGHRAIGQWAERGGVTVHVTTQNIDDLHERGGSKNVAHLHGSLFRYRCSICSKPARMPELPTEQIERATPPTCTLCGNPVRPGVVWFGEALPEAEWKEAERRMRTADALVIVGTSGVVYPAAGLPLMAHAREIPIIEVTPMRTELSHLADVVIEDTAANALPSLLG